MFYRLHKKFLRIKCNEHKLLVSNVSSFRAVFWLSADSVLSFFLNFFWLVEYVRVLFVRFHSLLVGMFKIFSTRNGFFFFFFGFKWQIYGSLSPTFPNHHTRRFQLRKRCSRSRAGGIPQSHTVTHRNGCASIYGALSCTNEYLSTHWHTHTHAHQPKRFSDVGNDGGLESARPLDVVWPRLPFIWHEEKPPNEKSKSTVDSFVRICEKIKVFIAQFFTGSRK